MTNFFNLSRKKGQFYLKSKEPQEGYEEVTYGEGQKTYHQYHKSIKGVPTYFGTKEVDYKGTKLNFLELALEDNGTTNQLSVNLYNKNGYTDEVKTLISALDGLEMGEEVSINPTTSKYVAKNGKEYNNLNIYINYLNRKDENGRNPSTGFIHFDSIPKPVKKTVAGRDVWDWTEQTEFYYQKIQEVEKKFATSEEPSVPSKEEDKTNNSRPESDDLPF